MRRTLHLAKEVPGHELSKATYCRADHNFILQVVQLDDLPVDLVNLLAKQLDAQSLRSLRQVSVLLCSKVSQLWTTVTMNCPLKSRQAQRLQGFQSLTSLTLEHPDTTFYLTSLTSLTKVSLAGTPAAYPWNPVSLTVDFGPLSCLPQLHTLALRCAAPVTLTNSSAMADLTQLRELELWHCSTRSTKGQIAESPSEAWASRPHDFSCLPQLTKLLAIDSLLWLAAGLINLQKVDFGTTAAAWLL